MRWDWKEGPTKGSSHIHEFHTDGSVEYRHEDAKEGETPTREKEYSARKVSEDVYLVSYLGSSGYTLTVALNFENHHMVGIASHAKEWYPVEGTFEVID
jgi:hypothetical protein